MSLYKILGIFLKITLSFGILFSLQGCIYENGEEPSSASSDLHITVKIKMPSFTSTRASHSDDYEEPGTEAEDYIDFDENDVRIILFDKRGNYLFDLDSDDKWETGASNGNGAIYHTYQTDLIFPEDTPEQTIDAIKNQGVRVMVVANWKAAKAADTYEGLFVNPDETTRGLDDIWKEKTGYNFTYPVAAGATSWKPDISSKHIIPMFGIGDSPAFATTGRVSQTIVTVQMQRTLAKIEVFDALEEEDVEIENVTMTDFNSVGRLIPDLIANPDWNAPNAQVDLSSLPTDVKNLKGLTFFKEGENKWVAYVPEMELDKMTPTDKLPLTRTHLDVKIKGLGSLFPNPVYPLHFARYDENSVPSVPDESWNHILRNHIYRYTVEKVGIETKIHLHVIPWRVDDAEVWDFTDNVSVKPLRWTDGTYDKLNQQTGEIELSLDQNTALTGIFQIMSPVNGRWYVSMVPLDGANPSAISFVDSEGNVLEPKVGDPGVCLEINGIIPGPAETVIYIKPTSYEGQEESRFRLEFYVENLGTWIEVPMVPGEVSNYIIVRKGNILQ